MFAHEPFVSLLLFLHFFFSGFRVFFGFGFLSRRLACVPCRRPLGFGWLSLLTNILPVPLLMSVPQNEHLTISYQPQKIEKKAKEVIALKCPLPRFPCSAKSRCRLFGRFP